jgi:hypothetical protein
MVSVLASSAVDCGLKPWSGQTKDYKIGICSFSAKHTTSRRKSKDWLAQNQNNVSEWSDMSTRGLLFQWASTIKIQLSEWASTIRIQLGVLVKYKADLIIISLKNNLFSPSYCWNIAELALSNNHSLKFERTNDCTFSDRVIQYKIGWSHYGGTKCLLRTIRVNQWIIQDNEYIL